MKEVIVKLNSDRIKIRGGEYVQDLVRCGECKHNVSDGGAIMVCEHTDIPTEDDHFCGYGEVRDE